MLAGDYGKVSMKVLCEGWAWLTFPKGPPILESPAQGCRRCRGSWGYIVFRNSVAYDNHYACG